eukprot:NODE_40_length_35084_cov_0.543519.p19 type:complete len:196 gc:universal NODE_40_length_35084_cov_0.543519:32158-32745(+)
MKLVWGFTGSVASIKYEEIQQICKNDQVIVIISKSAKFFIPNLQPTTNVEVVLEKLRSDQPFWIIVDEEAEWQWKKKTDPVLHIELRKWMEAIVIAPLSANSLAKLSNGICDSLLLCVARAIDFEQAKMVVCPCMNTQMYLHPITTTQIELLKSWGCNLIYPEERELACGDVGVGAIPPIKVLYESISNLVLNIN